MQSLRNKIDELQCFLKTHECDILVLTETWLSKEETQYFNLDGLQGIHSCREGRGGGVSIYIKNKLDHSVVSKIEGYSPYNMIKVSITKINLNILAIYRPPRYDLPEFLDVFQDLLTQNNQQTIILGDINVNILNTESQDTSDYMDAVKMCGYRVANVINKDNATRVSNNCSSLIDHVIVNKNIECKVSVLDCVMSDHNPMEISVSIKPVIFKPKVQRKIEIVDKVKFKNNFEKHFYQPYVTNRVINSFNDLIDTIKDCKNRASYEIEITNREGNNWMTLEILNLIKQRDKMYKKLNYLRKNKIQVNNKIEHEFNKLKNMVTDEIRKQKSLYFSEKWNKAGTNMKKQWNVINSLINKKNTSKNISMIEINGTGISDPLRIVNEFNQFFSNIGQTIVTSVNNEYLNNIGKIHFNELHVKNSVFMNSTTQNEVNSVLMDLNVNSAAGSDGITVKDLLIIKDLIIPGLTNLINNTFKSGIFPEVLKTGKIVPIFKSGDTKILTNYRPITVIPTFSKLIECLIKTRITSFIEQNIGFDTYQYGFSKGSNTESAITDFLNYVNTELDNKKIIVTVFVDLKKAFDVVDHDVLLSKFYFMGIRGTALTLLKTYLNDRRQYVLVDGVISDVKMSNYGVPQGSVLGPLFYILLVLSLRLAGLSGRYFTFADDTALVYTGADIDLLETQINNDLLKYSQWLLHNKLKINIEKTVYMVFHQKNVNLRNIHLKINNTVIKQVSYTKYLGLIIDEKLNWSKHLEHINNKIVPMLGALARCAAYLNHSNRTLIYNAYILSNLRYLIAIWGTMGSVKFKKLQRLQNKAIKILHRIPYLTPTTYLYRETKLNPLPYILELEQCKLIYKIINHKQKSNSEFIFNEQVHTHNTRGINDIHLTASRTNKGLYNPLTQAIVTFNKLPLHIRGLSTCGSFVKNLKTFLDSKTYLETY